ncbi:MAG: 3-hydroxybutyryl-CoA dehydrogenase [Nitrospira sp.]|nr:3-hydroxybutyryl-CoA dehydrogenase [Nitrospira sp.]
MHSARRVVVFGAGTMGAGIAGLYSRGGWKVRCVARRESSIRRAASYVKSEFGIDEGVIDFGTDFEVGLEGADLVIESVQESYEAKESLLKLIGPHLRASAIVTTNTSSLDLDRLALSLPDPTQFAGLHWFNPPGLVELVEVVLGEQTSPQVGTNLLHDVTALGKTGVLVRRPVKGFLANRLQYALLREAYSLVESGVCSWHDVDLAVTAGIGARWAAVGPFQSMDLAGLDVHAAVAREIFPDLSNSIDVPSTLTNLVGEGRLGCKTGYGLKGGYSDDVIEELNKTRRRILGILAAEHRN